VRKYNNIVLSAEGANDRKLNKIITHSYFSKGGESTRISKTAALMSIAVHRFINVQQERSRQHLVCRARSNVIRWKQPLCRFERPIQRMYLLLKGAAMFEQLLAFMLLYYVSCKPWTAALSETEISYFTSRSWTEENSGLQGFVNLTVERQVVLKIRSNGIPDHATGEVFLIGNSWYIKHFCCDKTIWCVKITFWSTKWIMSLKFMRRCDKGTKELFNSQNEISRNYSH